MDDFQTISRELSLPEVPHVDVNPLNVSRWINYLDSHVTSSPIYKNLKEFLDAFPSVNLLNVPEQYMLYCFMYGRSLETPYTPNTPRHIHTPVVHVIRSPVTPDTLQSEASLWSFTPHSTRSATSSIHPSSIEHFDDEDDFTPVDYDVRRQTAVRTANLRTLPDSPVVRQRNISDDEFSPVEYTERRQTNVQTANLKTMESPQVMRKKVDSPSMTYDFVDFDNVEISHQSGEIQGDTSSRPFLKTEVLSARITKQEAKKQKKRDSKKRKSRKGSKKSDKQSPEERENYRTSSIKRRPDDDFSKY